MRPSVAGKSADCIKTAEFTRQLTAAATADVSELMQKPLRQSKMQNETGTISAPVSLTKQEGDKMIPKDARQVLQVGQKLQLKISAWNQAGQGVARYNGIPIFVSAALPGEIWEITITSVKKNYAQAALLKPEKTVEFRTTPRCSHYGVCGSCELQHMTYAATLRFKTEKVEQACRSIAKLDTTDVLQATLPSPVNQHYRCPSKARENGRISHNAPMLALRCLRQL